MKKKRREEVEIDSDGDIFYDSVADEADFSVVQEIDNGSNNGFRVVREIDENLANQSARIRTTRTKKLPPPIPQVAAKNGAKKASKKHLIAKNKMRPTTKAAVPTGEVDPSWFESPVERLKVSGGTAPFFTIDLTDYGLNQVTARYTDKKSDDVKNSPLITKSCFIGKDLSHAADEMDFYDNIRNITELGLEKTGVGLLSYFMFDYLGVLNATSNETKTIVPSKDNRKNSKNNTKTEERIQYKLLVMQNLRNDYKKFRMLDIKIGQQTAQGGWKGKSRLRAFKQIILDKMTNSLGEGYRLEGFDGYPDAVESMDPLLDLLANNNKSNDESTKLIGGKTINEKTRNKARRVMLQNMKGSEILMHLLDLHSSSSSSEDLERIYSSNSIENRLTPMEVIEIALREIATRLIKFALRCHSLKVPQKWIGSSVALGFDAGLFPFRSKDDAAAELVRSKVIANIFDWGRSELLLKHEYKLMSKEDKNDRNQFWQNYKESIDRLAYNAVRAYHNKFSSTMNGQYIWKEIIVRVMDFDSMSEDDSLGQVTIPLPSDPYDEDAMKEIEDGEYSLSGRNAIAGCLCIIPTFVKNKGSISISITWVDLPESSRLCGVWRVKLIRAFKLIPADPLTESSDPYCLVIARTGSRRSRSSNLESWKRKREFHQMTSIKKRELNPVWNETISIPVVKYEAMSHDVLFTEGVSFDKKDGFKGSVRESGKNEYVDSMFEINTDPTNEKNMLTRWSTKLRESAVIHGG